MEMKKLPNGYIIKNPHDLINTGFYIADEVLKILNTNKNKVYFTRLSVKHLSEKHDGEYLLGTFKEILKYPDKIYLGNFSNRFLISKIINFKNKNKRHIVNIEVTHDQNNIIVLGFIVKESYFKNLRLLWGTASPHLNNP
jgi:hypothetical protein